MMMECETPILSVKAQGTVVHHAWMQDYLRHLPPGNYSVPYTLQWRSLPNPNPNPNAQTTTVLNGKGRLQFQVTAADPQALRSFINERLASVMVYTDMEKHMDASRELSLIDDPAAAQVFTEIARTAKKPEVVGQALAEVESHGGVAPSDVLRRMMLSHDKRTRVGALKHMERGAPSDYLLLANAATDDGDPDVATLALEVRKKLFFRLFLPQVLW
jgi:hypothetical protein